ncbi:MAG TPA: endonuclease V, partial [Amycolatopsis sp.]|nr:endonuclease V [Amycolatopsis sp.]
MTLLWQAESVHFVDVPEWPATAEEAVAVQERLRKLVDLGDDCPELPPTVTGFDVAYDGDRVAAAAVTLGTSDFRIIEQQCVTEKAAFPYEPGLFAFRELPPLLAALNRMRGVPDVLVCDGHGLAHPRRF